MKTTTLIQLLQCAALLHVGLMMAGLLMPRAVEARKHLALVSPFVRQLFWVYYIFIGFSLASFGWFTFVFAEFLANGSGPARAINGFLAIFWIIRLTVACLVFDMTPYLTTRWKWLGYQGLNIVFAVLPFVYGYAAWKGGVP